jgi:phosphoribosylaminoimidazole-succinocarboxamide synthase
MNRGEFIRKKVSENLKHAMRDAEIPELGVGRRGKVRHVYGAADAHGEDILIISTSDRVSAFDVVLDRAIPYKGAVLNAIAKWSFDQTQDIIPNALLRMPCSHIMIQKELMNIGFECVMRGYMWGSLAVDYEKGMRKKCGVPLKKGLLRYQKLAPPLFTPTTKAQRGHDRDVTLEEMAVSLQQTLGPKGFSVNGWILARKVREISHLLYRRGEQLARKVGLALVDTKYEFGLDGSGNLYLIDEIHTPDSSRYVVFSEWKQKWSRIQTTMKSGKWPNVAQLLQDHPELKVQELSKQLVRDLLIERGYDPNSGDSTTLSDEDVVETSARYIELYERLTSHEFHFKVDLPDGNGITGADTSRS